MSDYRPTFEAHEFRKATRSEPDKDCVRVARRDGWVELRDDKTTFDAPDDHRLVFTAEQFDTFLNGTRAGETGGHCLEITRRADGGYAFLGTVAQASDEPAPSLKFSETEVAAFLDGVAQREFDPPAYPT